MRTEYERNKKHIEELREKLHQLIEEEGVSSRDVIKISTDLDKLIVKHYPKIFS
jgi:cupin superfamily acireductone dioxygenase involved in methionine salvage